MSVTNEALWQLSSLAIRVSPERWPDWISSTVAAFSSRGCSTEKIVDFLAIVAEEVHGADLVQLRKLVSPYLHPAQYSRSVGPPSTTLYATLYLWSCKPYQPLSTLQLRVGKSILL